MKKPKKTKFNEKIIAMWKTLEVLNRCVIRGKVSDFSV